MREEGQHIPLERNGEILQRLFARTSSNASLNEPDLLAGDPRHVGQLASGQSALDSCPEEREVWLWAWPAGLAGWCGPFHVVRNVPGGALRCKLVADRILNGAGQSGTVSAVQPPITKRVRAARGAVNMSLDDFADAIHIGRSTLIRIENGSRAPEDHELAEMARVSGFPREFFNVPDLNVALGAEADESLRARVEEIAADLADLRRSLAVERFADASKRSGEGGRGSTQAPSSPDHLDAPPEAGDR